MTSPLKKDKMGVYIELLEADVWIHKTNTSISQIKTLGPQDQNEGRIWT
jgi:hypothetical protein